MTVPAISVAIPTYMREQILIETIKQVLDLNIPPAEILIVDQTPVHEQETDERLQALAAAGKIRWFRLERPSIPCAMNHALCKAKGDIVLFLDDDVGLISEIVAAHASGHQEKGVALVAGQVVQSWQNKLNEQDASIEVGKTSDPDAFRFNSVEKCWIKRFMGGNFSIRKDVALRIGGFDENFVKVAYRFEAEFADRLQAAGHKILFFPEAAIRHLKAESGGTRTFGEHLRTVMPSHSVGRYYYLLVAGSVSNRRGKILFGPFRAVKTRFHLTNPWWIPLTLLAEWSGVVWALFLYVRGPRHLVKKED